jgi:regulator of nucleoside diphosphate kinase
MGPQTNGGHEVATRGIVLTEHDVAELNRLIQSRAAFYRHDVEHIEALARELDRADVVTAATLTPDVVTMRSRVRVRDLETGRRSIYTIVPPTDADVAARRVSVLAAMGTALLGYRVGDAVEWSMPGGRRRLLVEEILYQPEAAGDGPKERSWRDSDGMCSVAGRRPW